VPKAQPVRHKNAALKNARLMVVGLNGPSSVFAPDHVEVVFPDVKEAVAVHCQRMEEHSAKDSTLKRKNAWNRHAQYTVDTPNGAHMVLVQQLVDMVRSRDFVHVPYQHLLMVGELATTLVMPNKK
jgi:hypothetical protein